MSKLEIVETLKKAGIPLTDDFIDEIPEESTKVDNTLKFASIRY